MIQLKNISEIVIENKIVIGGTPRRVLAEALAIYSFFNESNSISIEKRIAFLFLSKKCVFSARDITTNKILGIELYYLNRKDIIERTVHQGFRGVLPEWQGRKIGTMITAHAINHFKKSCIKGISSRVSLNNLPSLKSNMNLGFKPVEKYVDKTMNEERYYLICPFEDNPS